VRREKGHEKGSHSRHKRFFSDEQPEVGGRTAVNRGTTKFNKLRKTKRKKRPNQMGGSGPDGIESAPGGYGSEKGKGRISANVQEIGKSQTTEGQSRSEGKGKKGL